MVVQLIHWPAEKNRLAELRADGRPRLLLIDAQEPAPISSDPLEDWVRLPAADSDIQARVEALGMRTPEPPKLDADDVLWHGKDWIALGPVEVKLMEVLLERFGKVVGRDVLVRRAWPDERPSRNVLDVHVLRLRRRLGPLGLQLHTVRKRGYLLGW